VAAAVRRLGQRHLLLLPGAADRLAWHVQRDWDGQVLLKRMTSELVNRFVAAAVDATRARYGDGPLGRYAADLVVPAPVAAEVALLKAVAVRYVMADPVRLRLQAEQREILFELVEALAAGAPGTLAGPMRENWSAAEDDAARRRVVIDQVATLTDQQAYAWHTRLVLGRSTQ